MPFKTESRFSNKAAPYGAAISFCKGVNVMDKPKIRFITTRYDTLFLLDDGRDIEVEVDGNWIPLSCQFIDETHAYIGGHVYHIYEFAELREKLGQRYRPAETKAG
jgi:hypothetical protein